MRALVLSCGGAFGAYQVGAWRALEEMNWLPDVVVGASIGAVNGFAISRGCRPEQLHHLWRELPREIHAAYNGSRRLPIWRYTRLFRSWVREIHRRYGSGKPICQLQVPLAALPGCGLRTFHGEDITEQHLLAACAVLGWMLPVKVDGAFCFDSGAFCHLPVRQAILAGATEIVAVDAMAVHPWPPLRKVLKITTRVRNRLRGETTEAASEQLTRVRLTRVGRRQALGSLSRCLRWDSQFVEALIETGFHDTKSQFGALREDDSRRASVLR